MKNVPSYRTTLLACVLAIVASPKVHAQAFNDTFTGGVDPGWTTDRYEPDGFASVLFDGGERLRITIGVDGSTAGRGVTYAGSFYATQGRAHDAVITGDWTAFGQLYVSEDMLTTSAAQRTDL